MDSEELYAILAEQSRELVAAIAAESDLDVAYHLQMQEAMNASLGLQPTSSSPASTPEPFQLPDDDVPDPSFASLIAEEIARFEQERRDCEQAGAAMQKMRDDLSRQIHDQAFARELFRISEGEWNQTGDHFSRPYGEGSSSSSSSSSGSIAEAFRLYFKGLVREETVRGVRKTSAGIGIAICDLEDHLIFQLRKPLPGGSCGEIMSLQVADGKALIEGMDVAFSLGIKRITLFCDDHSLYQYVTGKLIPRQGTIATLVGQVALLQRKFSYCSTSLVARKDIKFALELANEALMSQVAWPAECSRGICMKETCSICLEDVNVSQMVSIDGCLHTYCSSCLRKHVEVKLLHGVLPQCPHEGCKSELKLESCKKFVAPELVEIMSQRIKENSINPTQKIYCPYPRCSTLMSKAEAFGSTNNAGASKCKSCHGLFCMNCKVPWHSNMSCNVYKGLHPYPCAEDAKLKSLATRNLWRQCVKCSHMVELAEGCNHIYCRCGHEFCYICGVEWKDKKATCKCPLWDERNIVHGGHQA